MRVISILLLLVFTSYIFSDDTFTIQYDPLRIFDEELEKSKSITTGGAASFYTGLFILLAASACFGVGYSMVINEGSYNYADTLLWSGVGGMAGGFAISISGLIAWFAGNNRALRALENKTEYLHITSGM